MDNFGVMARIKEFDRRNGGNALRFNGWFHYANGARRDEEPLGALIDAPENEYDRLTNILTYHKGRLVQAVRNFDALKEELVMSAFPDGEGLDRLKQLQTVVGQCNEAVNVAKSQLEATEVGKRREAMRKHEVESRAERASFGDSVRAVRI